MFDPILSSANFGTRRVWFPISTSTCVAMFGWHLDWNSWVFMYTYSPWARDESKGQSEAEMNYVWERAAYICTVRFFRNECYSLVS
ncbi:hypothetical protein ACLOJK_014248 [Asimina triloba]